MYRKIYVTASEMLEMRKQGMSNHDIAKSLDISVPTVIRYIGKQGERMENLAAFADPPTRKKRKKETEAPPVVPKYEPKPVKEAYVIGNLEVTLNNDDRVLHIHTSRDDSVAYNGKCISYDDIPDFVQFLAWAMRERMDVM